MILGTARKTWRRAAWPMAVAAVLMCAAALAQTPTPPAGPVTLSEMQGYAALSERDQARQAVQARIHQWFLEQIEAYRTSLTAYQVGRRAKLGPVAWPPDPVYQTVLGAPTGTGPARVIWRNEPNLSPQKQPGGDFRYPADRVAVYFGETQTAWHEMQHGLMEAQDFTLPSMDPFRRYLDQQQDNEPHHVFIEGLGQNTVKWLTRLGKTFEPAVSQAAAREHEYVNVRGMQVNYELQRQIWTAAHFVWVQAYNDARKMAPLTPALRDRYRQTTGVDLPTYEDVIQFYMGALRSKFEAAVPVDGKGTLATVPIAVPRWVMTVPDLVAHVLIKEEAIHSAVVRPDPGSKAREARHVWFDFRLQELEGAASPTADPLAVSAIHHRRPAPVTRGTLDATVDGPDGKARIGLDCAGRPVALPLDLKNVEAALVGPRAAPNPFRLHFYRPDPSRIAKPITYTVTIRYRDDPGAGPSAYYPTQAVFHVDFKPGPPPSGGPGVPPPPASPAPQQPSEGGDGSDASPGQQTMEPGPSTNVDTSDGFGPQSGKQVTAVTSRQPEPPPKRDPRLDEVPPKPGEEFEFVPPPDEPPPPPEPPKPRLKWYTHPSGDYRFAVPVAWKIRRSARESQDQVLPSDGAFCVWCQTDYGLVSAAETQATLAELARNLVTYHRGAKVSQTDLAGAPARLVTAYDAKSQSMKWHILAAHGGRLYHIMIEMPQGTGESEMPQAASAHVLGTFQWLGK